VKTSTIVLLVILLLVAGFLGLFGWQNLATRVDLVLDLGPIGGWYIAKAFPVPYMLGIAFGSGFLVALMAFGGRAFSAGRRARSAEQRAAALQDELDWSKRNTSSTVSKTPAKKPPVKLEKKAPKVPVAAPKKDATDPPDFDDLI